MRRFLLSIGFIVLIGQLAYSQNPFRTRQSGNWNDPNTWEEDTGGGFNPTLNTPSSASGTINILNSHTVTITANVTIDQTTIQSGGIITINPSISLSININASGLSINSGGVLNNNGTVSFVNALGARSIVVNGTLNNSGTFTFSTSSRLVFNSGSNYFHLFANGGTIPNAGWNSNSNVNIIGYTTGNSTPPSGLSQTFGNFIWDCPNQDQIVSLNAGITNVVGNLTVLNTGAGGFYFSTNGTGFSLTISGSLVIGNSGAVGVSSGDTGPSTLTVGSISVSGNGYIQFAEDQPVTINCNGDFSVSGGQVEYSAAGAATTFNLLGNFNQTGGQILSTAGNGVINFIGNSTQIVTSTIAATGNMSYSVSGASTVSIPGNNFISGTGTLTVDGVLQVGSTNSSGAIQTGTSNGNVRLGGTRTYNSGSTIVYNGSPGFIGSGHPTTAGVNVEINSSGVSLVGNRTIGGNLTLTAGNLTIGSNTLTLNGNLTPNSNFLAVNSSSSLSIGGTGSFGNLAMSGGPTINNFTLNRTSSGSVTLAGNLTVNGTYTQSNGDVNLNGNMLRISGPYVKTSGTKIGSSSSSIIVDGSGTFTGTLGIVSPLNTLEINRAGGTVNTSSSFTVTNLNLLDGALGNGASITMAANGIVTRNSGSLSSALVATAASTYSVVYTNSSVSPLTTGFELPLSTSDLGNLTINCNGPINLNSSITVNGILTFTSGNFNAGSNAIDLKGNLVSNSSSTLTSSTITFSGATSVTGSAAPVFGNVTITGSLTPTSSLSINGNLLNNGTLNSGSATVTFGGTTAISGTSICSFNNLVISPASSLTGPLNGTINVAGTWTNNGTFTDNGGTVVFNGTSSITGATNFGGVTITGTLTSPASLNVARNFTNNGTFVAGSGTLVLNGSSIQSISGTTTTTFNNITVTNTAGPPAVQVQSNQNLQGVLTLSANSQFDADGSSNTSVFTLLSTNDNSTSDASIAALPSGASVTGNVTVQRFMAIEGGNNTRIYRFISSPVQSAPVSQIQTFIPVTGTFSGASSCSGCGTSQSMFAYDESVITGDQNAGYINFPAAGNSETFTSGRGYSIFVRGNTAPISTAGNARWSLTGPINSGSINFNPFTTFNSSGTLANDGWNLVGNPYPSTIDWDAAGWTRTNINNAIYMRDNGQSGVFATYISGASVNGGSRYIPTGQAFFVKSDGGTIDFRATESVKAAGTQTTFFRQETVNDFLRMTLSGNGVRDEAVIRFQKEASDVYDSKQDARKLRNGSDTSPIVSLSSISSDGVLLAINSANSLGCKNLVPFKKIALMIDGVRAGSHQLSFSQLDSFTEDIMIVLHDQFKNDSVVVNQSNFAYDFDVTSDAKSFGRDRFSISFTCKNLITSIPDNKENSIHIFPNPASDKVQIEIPYNSNIVATMLNSVGVPIGKVALIKEGDFWKGEFDLGSHATGFYFVQVSEGTKVYAKKVIKR